MLKSVVVMASAVFFSVLTGMGVLAINDRQGEVAPGSEDAVAASEVATTTTDNHVTAIPKASDGHFWANAVVNEKAVHFLVDTGATVVVLTPADAQRLGFSDASLTYDHKVITANGPTQAADVTLSSVGVGQSTVHNVDALVLKDGLTTSLLGMSYLGRLSRFEATPSSLILHP
ncbi:MAG: TIGR02281 family clan AA aspartic protease [Asticcacaulis sp.]